MVDYSQAGRRKEMRRNPTNFLARANMGGYRKAIRDSKNKTVQKKTEVNQRKVEDFRAKGGQVIEKENNKRKSLLTQIMPKVVAKPPVPKQTSEYSQKGYEKNSKGSGTPKKGSGTPNKSSSSKTGNEAVKILTGPALAAALAKMGMDAKKLGNRNVIIAKDGRPKLLTGPRKQITDRSKTFNVNKEGGAKQGNNPEPKGDSKKTTKKETLLNRAKNKVKTTASNVKNKISEKVNSKKLASLIARLKKSGTAKSKKALAYIAKTKGKVPTSTLIKVGAGIAAVGVTTAAMAVEPTASGITTIRDKEGNLTAKAKSLLEKRKREKK